MDQKLDRTALIAIALCILFVIAYQPLLRWLGLSRYVEPRRQPVETVDSSAVRRASEPGPPASMRDTAADRVATGVAPAPELARIAPDTSASAEFERTLAIETPLLRAEFSSRGARLVGVELKHYASAHGVSREGGTEKVYHRGDLVAPGDRATLAGGPLLALDLGSGAAIQSLANVAFAVAESLDAAGELRAITFTHQDTSGLFVRQTYRVHPDRYAFDCDVELRGVPASWRLSDYSLTTRSWPLLTEADLKSDARALRATSLVGTSLHREHAGGLVRGPKRFDGNALWAGVQSRYFLSGIVVEEGAARGVISSAVRRPFTAEELSALPKGAGGQQEIAINSLVLGLPSEHQPVNRFLVYVGPCEYAQLASFKLGLERAVDLGWSWLLPFSKALLQLLNWIYAVVRNYGVAILLLATLVRLLLHPLNMTSMRSMRAMQRLQPEIERIRQKYKSDPQALNAATMALYKEHKVNPAGGCLPMLVQMPMFIALYSVLFNAIELRQAPFVAWMRDLSAPDLLFMAGSIPVRLLPILMAGSGLLQQAFTPTSPEQRPTMYIMNVVMLVFFYNLPSGLVLYWTVMNLLTAAQQWYLIRKDGAPVLPQPVVATAGGGRKKGR